jgi:hypothetical protein
MNLKNAFRYQNKLGNMLNQCTILLSSKPNLTKITETHLRSKVVKEDEDLVITNDNSGEDLIGNINNLMGFAMYLLAQKELLTKAIRKAKIEASMDIDGETSMNQSRQNLAKAFSYMADLKASENVITGGGSGVKFNADGEQVTYRCDLKRVISIDYDRNKVKSNLKALSKKANETSEAIDAALVTATVDYDPPFDVDDTIVSIFNAWVEANPPETEETEG